MTWDHYLKKTIKHIHGYSYFWRTYEQREIDLIEERGGKLFPYEFKWSKKSRVYSPKDWIASYPQAQKLSVVATDNYFNFIA